MAGSTQEQWLRNDLAATPLENIAAIWHHPRYSSGPHGPTLDTQALWQALYDHGAELVIGGHDHLYERFAPMDPAGNVATNGIRQFVVGTGGAGLGARSTSPRTSPATAPTACECRRLHPMGPTTPRPREPAASPRSWSCRWVVPRTRRRTPRTGDE